MMNIAVSLTLCIALANFSADRQTGLSETLEDFRKAMLAADEATLSELTSLFLSYGHSNEVVEHKNEFIASLVSGKYRFLSIRLSGQQVIMSGNTAIVRHSFEARTADAGKYRTSIKLHVMMVWLKYSYNLTFTPPRFMTNPSMGV